jgi:MAP kinase interacting serine/threonine kinase
MSSKMDIVNTKNDCLNVERRESIDSGVGLSPSPSPSPASINGETPRTRRNKKKKKAFSTLSASSFSDLYSLKNDILGEGSYGRVESCVNVYTQMEYAVKIIEKDSWTFNRQKMLKEIELYYLCQPANDSIIQLVDYFEETDKFYLIFEKAYGGHLLNQINKRGKFNDVESAAVIVKLASALKYLHSRGIAHRDLKPENILCMEDAKDAVALNIRLCDFDLCSKVQPTVSTPRLSSPAGSPEYLAPEVVEVFVNEDNILYDLLDEDLSYDKRCDLWSLGVIAYTLLCGRLPFNGRCGRDCGWEDRNEECEECQQDLYDNIKNGYFHIPEHVSPLAKDLIRQLLQTDPDMRLEASDVLDHPWIVKHTTNDSIDTITDASSLESFGVAAEVTDETIEMYSAPASPNSLRKASSISLMFPLATKPTHTEQPGVKASAAKFRRQSSVVTSFCQPREDMLCRCEL